MNSSVRIHVLHSEYIVMDCRFRNLILLSLCSQTSDFQNVLAKLSFYSPKKKFPSQPSLDKTLSDREYNVVESNVTK